MTLGEFQERYKQAHWTAEEYAKDAVKVTDNPVLVGSALVFLTAKNKFKRLLEELGVELE